MANGARTHDLRNHNPDDSGSKSLPQQQLTSTPADGCTVGRTRIEVGTHETVESLAAELRLVFDCEGLDRLVRLLTERGGGQ